MARRGGSQPPPPPPSGGTGKWQIAGKLTKPQETTGEAPGGTKAGGAGHQKQGGSQDSPGRKRGGKETPINLGDFGNKGGGETPDPHDPSTLYRGGGTQGPVNTGFHPQQPPPPVPPHPHMPPPPPPGQPHGHLPPGMPVPTSLPPSPPPMEPHAHPHPFSGGQPGQGFAHLHPTAPAPAAPLLPKKGAY